jgi:hypothetical protein
MRTTIIRTWLLGLVAVLAVTGLGCDEGTPDAADEYPVVYAYCGVVLTAETEHVVADTFVTAEFDADEGVGAGRIAHHALTGSVAGELVIDGEDLPPDLAIEIEGPVAWTDDTHEFISIAFEPGPEVPDEYRITLTGDLDITTHKFEATMLGVVETFNCGTLDVSEGL